jgi:hypothetical protein
MRCFWALLLLATLTFSPSTRAGASTFNLPLAGEVEIVGDISIPVSISLSMTVNPLGASYWVFETSIEQSGSANGAFSEPLGCVGASCGNLAGFYVCGGRINCGIEMLLGTVVSRTGEPVSFDVSDTSRFLVINTSVWDDSPIGLELTANLPDGLEVVILNDPLPAGVAETPLPATLPLFATGMGLFGLFKWRRKQLQSSPSAETL